MGENMITFVAFLFAKRPGRNKARAEFLQWFRSDDAIQIAFRHETWDELSDYMVGHWGVPEEQVQACHALWLEWQQGGGRPNAIIEQRLRDCIGVAALAVLYPRRFRCDEDGELHAIH
jgi:hypothetical protein